MPDHIKEQSHFFIDPSGVTQVAAQAFGPVAGNEANEFRLTSGFSCNGTAKAFAICKGIVLVQPQAGNTGKVNLVLRPFTQPFPGLNIKYFVYRGLQKSDFFTTATVPEVVPVASSVSDLVQKLHTDFDAFYATPLKDVNGDPIPKPSFTADKIGFIPAVPDQTLLSDVFFKQSVLSVSGSSTQETDAYELPMIDEGKSLGHFEGSDCGIDVVLHYGDYKNDFDNGEFVFDLTYARASEAKISLSGTDAEKKLQKEQAVQFIDIAAFFGLFVRTGKIRATTGSAVLEKTGQAIYTDLLSPFFTKNRWYVYIQGDRGRSYNYYGNYGVSATGTHDLKLGISETAMILSTYGSYGWPLLIDTQSPATASVDNKLFLQLVTDNNPNTVLYCLGGVLLNQQQNSFFGVADLCQPLNTAVGQNKLTKVFSCSNPAASDGKNIAGITKIIYQGAGYQFVTGQVLDQNNQLVDEYATGHSLEGLFDLVKAKPVFKNGQAGVLSRMTSERQRLVNHSIDQRSLGISLVQTVRTNDSIDTGTVGQPLLERVTYSTETTEVSAKAADKKGAVAVAPATSSAAGSATGQAQTFRLSESYFYELVEFTDSMIPVKGLLLKTSDGSLPGQVIVGLTKDEQDLLSALVAPGVRNPRLFLLDLHKGDNLLVSPEGTTYLKFRVGLVVEEGTILKMLLPAQDIIAYSLDRYCHFSESYSAYVRNNSFQPTIQRSL